MTKLNPYLRFNDKKCKEAMTFYQKCLGGKLSFQTIGETPAAKEMPPDAQDNIMHSSLETDSMQLYASDMMRDKATVGDNISLSLNFESEDELRKIFSALSEGGEVFMQPEKQFWGGIFGVVTDKYGVEWMLNYQEE